MSLSSCVLLRKRCLTATAIAKVDNLSDLPICFKCVLSRQKKLRLVKSCQVSRINQQTGVIVFVM